MWTTFFKAVIIILVPVVASLVASSIKYPDEIDQIYKTLQINDEKIPVINHPDVLEGALKSTKSCMDNPLNITRKIVSEFDAASMIDQPGAEADLKKISFHFDTLCKIVQPITVMKAPNMVETHMLRKFRNACAHDNYYWPGSNGGRNEAAYQTLKSKLTSVELAKLPGINSDDWVIWNIDKRMLLICFIISNKKLRPLIKIFTKDCWKMIEKSKKNHKYL